MKRARTVNLARVRANRARERALLDAIRVMRPPGPSSEGAWLVPVADRYALALMNMERAGWSRTDAAHALDMDRRARVAEMAAEMAEHEAEIAACRARVEALDPDAAAFMFDAVSLPPIPPGEP